MTTSDYFRGECPNGVTYAYGNEGHRVTISAMVGPRTYTYPLSCARCSQPLWGMYIIEELAEP